MSAYSLCRVQTLRVKQAENTEIQPLNGVYCHKFIVRTGKMSTENNRLK